MAIISNETGYLHRRQNRRRERPGSRSRRAVPRKNNFQQDCDDGLIVARDSSILLPSDRPMPSPLFRQNFDRTWQRWKTRQAQETALDEMDRMQLEQELQQRLFGGEVDDDELYRLGILDKDVETAQDSEANTVSFDLPSLAPSFVTQRGFRRCRQRPAVHSVPLYLSFSCLSDDADIARLLSHSNSDSPTIQHREFTFTSPTTANIPLSLPPTPTLESAYVSNHLLENDISSPSYLHTGDWTFVTTTSHQIVHDSTPSSDPETWILLGDDS